MSSTPRPWRCKRRRRTPGGPTCPSLPGRKKNAILIHFFVCRRLSNSIRVNASGCKYIFCTFDMGNKKRIQEMGKKMEVFFFFCSRGGISISRLASGCGSGSSRQDEEKKTFCLVPRVFLSFPKWASSPIPPVRKVPSIPKKGEKRVEDLDFEWATMC